MRAIGVRLAAVNNAPTRIIAMLGVTLSLTAAPIPVSAQTALKSTSTNWTDSGRQFTYNNTVYALGTYTFKLSWDTTYPDTFWSDILQSQPWYGSDASAASAALGWASQTISRNKALSSFGGTYEEGLAVQSEIQNGIGYGFVGLFNFSYTEFETCEDESSCQIDWYQTLGVLSWIPGLCRDEPEQLFTLNAVAYLNESCSRYNNVWDVSKSGFSGNALEPFDFRFVGVQEITAPPTTVPEPATIVLLGAGLVGLAIARRRTS